MAREPSPIFLERGSYRRRRLMDAAKLVAILGAGLWMIPVLWASPDQRDAQHVSMSDALFYVFGVWLFLIVLSAVLVSRLRLEQPSEEQEGAGDDLP